MAAVREALKREGHTQVWVVEQLTQAGVSINRYTLSHYLTGYRRIPRHLLMELCALARIPVERVFARIGDEAMLLRGEKE